MGMITKTVSFPVSPAEAYRVHGDPRLWHTWIDGAQGPGQVTGDGGPDTTCRLDIRAGGMTDPYAIKVEESAFAEGEGRFVARLSSPFLKIRETWKFGSEGAGTRATWDFEYQPTGFKGFVLRPFLPRLLSQSMDRSITNLQGLCAKKEGA